MIHIPLGLRKRLFYFRTVYMYTSVRVYVLYCTKIEKSLPQPQRDVYQIAVCFMFSVLEFQLFLLVIIWFVLQSIATNDL